MAPRRKPADAGKEEVTVAGPVASTGEVTREPVRDPGSRPLGAPDPIGAKVEAARKAAEQADRITVDEAERLVAARKAAEDAARIEAEGDVCLEDDPDDGVSEDPARAADLRSAAQQPLTTATWTGVRSSMTPTTPGIYARIAAVTAAVGPVPQAGQTGKGNPMGDFSYRKVDDVVDALGRLIAENGMAFVPRMVRVERVADGGNRIGLQVTMAFTLVDTVDGSRVHTEETAFGPFSPQGIGIAKSYALKSWLAQQFLVPFGSEGVKLGASMDLEDPRNQEGYGEGWQGRPAARPARPPATPPKGKKWDAEEWQRQMASRGVSIRAMEQKLVDLFGDGAPMLTSAAAILELETEQRSKLGRWLQDQPEVPEEDPWPEPPTKDSPTTFGDNHGAAFANRGRPVINVPLPDEDRDAIVARQRRLVEAETAALQAAREDYTEEDWDAAREAVAEDAFPGDSGGDDA